MTPEEIFNEVSDTLATRFSHTLTTLFKPVLRQLPGVWEQCVNASNAVENQDEELLSDVLHELDELVSDHSYGFAFEDLEYRLQLVIRQTTG
jgi:hypothetical protein